jgi:hypothetical protein
MKQLLNALVMAIVLPTKTFGVTDSYAECETLMEFTVELDQSSQTVAVGTTFTMVFRHVLTDEMIAENFIEVDGQYLLKAGIWFPEVEQSLPMIRLRSRSDVPLPQGATSVALYDLTGRDFETKEDFSRDGTFSVPLNCYPTSGIY